MYASWGGAYVQASGRNRVGRHCAGIERLVVRTVVAVEAAALPVLHDRARDGVHALHAQCNMNEVGVSASSVAAARPF